MNVLVVSAHPFPASFNAALATSVVSTISELGHAVRHRDLYAENFDPVFSSYERLHHVGDLSEKLETLATLRPYVEDLQWCESIVFVYPTWWSGQPAILKGWIDRILMNQVAWVLPEGAARIKPLLTQIRRVVVVTTHGSSKFVNALEGESGKRTIFRSVRLMMHRRTRCSWIAMYGLDNATEGDRKRFTEKVMRRTRRTFS
jgi:putative NADPH-quinone reductase